MRKKFFGILLLMVSVCSYGQLKSGYEIDITIHGLQDSTIFLAYHLGDKQYVKDTLRLDNSGHAKASGQEILPEGIYMIVIPGRKYFEILISKNQHFSLSCSFTDYFNTLKFTGSTENSAFLEYQKKWAVMQKRSADISGRIQKNKPNSDSLKILTSAQQV